MKSRGNKMSIAVYLPSRYVVKLNVSPNSQICELCNIVPYKNISFIFNGQLLCDKKTFKYYKIRKDDSVVILRDHQAKSEVQKWIGITQDLELFNDRMQMMLKSGNAREAARVRDIALTKIERKPRFFRKLCSSYKPKIVETESTAINIDFFPLEEPACDPLPTFFDYDTDFQQVPKMTNNEPIIAVDSVEPFLKP
ncbi:hypothetical protein TRFO_32777 [Tritrichomonas foetus]|uniref:Ubiquitin-like domain-containing protein n=1 Tax=Tritrichomonas foetus TaxID=1144522 RepID=A0A1J4JN04_9EUKA|nr:hypothetical protein TRFO_32777 [Tritrichomonas foetus]|eukprot:OHT00503.1 hypothetical protein TRFO_32777 [Tritrichomonas foetus]